MVGGRIRRCALAVIVASGLAIGSSGATLGADPSAPSDWSSAVEPHAYEAYLEEQRMLALDHLVAETRALGLYKTADGRTVVVVPASGRHSFSARDARALGIDVTVTTADLERHEIAEIKSLALAREWHPEAKQFDIGVLFDAALGKIRIMTNAPEYVYESLEAELAGKVAVQRDMPTPARTEDYQPHWGGAEIGCTSGFSVKTDTGKHRMLGAGHCAPVGTTIDSSEGSTFGEVTRNLWWGLGGNRDDMALIGRGWNEITMDPRIYVGGVVSTTSAGVLSAGLASQSADYCFSGATAGTRCNLRMTDPDYGQCMDGNPDVCWYNLQYFEGPPGSGVCGGDSGAPYFLDVNDYTPTNVYIRGMVVGQLDTGNCATNFVAIVEKWPKIASALDVTIKTI